MEPRKLSFDELMVLGAIHGGHLNPFQPQTWDRDPDFYRGLARVTAVVMKAKGGFNPSDSEQLEFWQKGNVADVCRQKVQATIESLQAKKVLGIAH